MRGRDFGEYQYGHARTCSSRICTNQYRSREYDTSHYKVVSPYSRRVPRYSTVEIKAIGE